MRQLIAIYASAPRSGKSTIASILDKKHNFKVISFAAPIKYTNAYLLTKLGYSESEAYRLVHVDKEEMIPELGVTSRYIQQKLGTDWGRNMIADDFWVKIAQVRIRKHERCVIDDLRHTNEALMIRKLGGEIWRVQRDSASYNGMHKSEGLLDNMEFDKIILNNSCLDNLEQLVASLIEN